jgi:hypothetical protein
MVIPICDRHFIPQEFPNMGNAAKDSRYSNLRIKNYNRIIAVSVTSKLSGGVSHPLE